MDKAVGAGRADGLFVEVASASTIAALQAGDLGADQRGAVLEILRAVRGPDSGAAGGGRPEPPDAAAARRPVRVAAGGLGQRAVEVIFGFLEVQR